MDKSIDMKIAGRRLYEIRAEKAEKRHKLEAFESLF
jgi:hypothetical protein